MAEQDNDGTGAIRINWPEVLGNTRAPEQFRQIVKAIDLRGKTIYDLGCGHVDLDWALDQIGANVVCVDIDPVLVAEATERGLLAICGNIETLYNLLSPDTVICFSVLPYLKDPWGFLRKLHAPILLLECQYASDGPGFAEIKNDQDMKHKLMLCGWHSEVIGRTFVPGRDLWRTIWMCTR